MLTHARCPQQHCTCLQVSAAPAFTMPDVPSSTAPACRYLQQGLGLDLEPGKPLVVCVTRLVPQKGIHLIRHAVHRTAEQGGQFVLLGSGHADGAFRWAGCCR